MNEYLGEDAVRVAFTPQRALYLIPDVDGKQNFRRAVREASSTWVGVTHPIIPVPVGGEITEAWRQVAELGDVDVAINVGVDPSDALTAANELGLGLNDVDSDQWAQTLHHWSVVSPPAFPINAARKDAPLWEVVALGDPADPGDGPPLLLNTRVPGEEIAALNQMHGHTVLQAGLGGFSEYEMWGSSADRPAVLFVARHGDEGFKDCLWFWNLRALRPLRLAASPMMLLPDTAFSEWQMIDQIVTGQLRRGFAGKPDVVASSGSVPQDELAEMLRTVGLVESDAAKIKLATVSIGMSPDRYPPFTFTVLRDLRPLFMFRRSAGYQGRARVQRFRERTSIPVDASSVGDHIGGPRFLSGVVRLRSQHTDLLPRRSSVAMLIHADARWHCDEVEIPAVVLPSSELEIATPSAEDVLVALIGSIGGHASTSDKGRLAEALLTARDCTPVVSADVLAIVKQLTTPRSKDLVRQLRSAEALGADDRMLHEIASLWGGRVERRHLSASEMGGVAAVPLLEKLVAQGWAERGLRSDCQRCGMKTFVPLEATGGPAACPGCNSASVFAADGVNLQTRYRLDSLVDRASDQGALPHLATLVALQIHEPQTCLSLGLNVRESGKQFELDVFGYVGPQVVAGEVKSSAAEFDRAQLDRDISATVRVGADSHVIACAQRLSHELIADVSQRCGEVDMRLLVVAPMDGDQIIARQVR